MATKPTMKRINGQLWVVDADGVPKERPPPVHPVRIALEALGLAHLLAFAVLWLWSPMLAFWQAVAPHPDAAMAVVVMLLAGGCMAGLGLIISRAFDQANP